MIDKRWDKGNYDVLVRCLGKAGSSDAFTYNQSPQGSQGNSPLKRILLVHGFRGMASLRLEERMNAIVPASTISGYCSSFLIRGGVGCYIFLELEGPDPTAVTVTLTAISTYLGRRGISI